VIVHTVSIMLGIKEKLSCHLGDPSSTAPIRTSYRSRGFILAAFACRVTIMRRRQLKSIWLREHDLFEIARQCAPQFPYYVQPEVTVKLERFSEFDKVARYPGIKQLHGNGFTSEDIPVIWDLIRRLRTDIPIPCDDYPLGMFVRGHHQGHPEFKVYSHVIAERAGCLAAFRRMFPDVDNIVRW
jgi:hypothetical protein